MVYGKGEPIVLSRRGKDLAAIVPMADLKLMEEIENQVIKGLAKDPRKPKAEPLEGKLKPYWKTRVGDYRIAYEILDDIGVDQKFHRYFASRCFR